MTGPMLTPRTRALAVALRGARESAGVGQRELAKRLGTPQPLLSYWERGHRVPKVEDVATVLGAIGVSGERREHILKLARDAAEPNWLASGIPGLSAAVATLVDCERTATAATQSTVAMIPGLLQTSDYARAVFEGGGLTAQQVETGLMARLARRDALTRRDSMQYTAFIGEAALRDNIGGAVVMADQLQYLGQIAERDNVTLRVMRSGIGWHPGLVGNFLIYEFLDTPSVVYLEHLRAGAFLYEDDEVQYLYAAAEQLDELAVGASDSTTMIAEIARELEAEQ